MAILHFGTGILDVDVFPYVQTPGIGGGRVISSELWRSDIAGNLVEDLSDVLVSGSVDWRYDRNGGLFGAPEGTSLACEFTIRDVARVTPLVDFLRPFLLLVFDDGRPPLRQPLGLFAVDQPAERHTATVGEVTLFGQDLTSVLRQSFFLVTTNALQGFEFDTQIRSFIQSGGIPANMHNIRDSTRTLGYARKFTQTWSRLAAVNKLARAVGWYRLFAELDGRLTTMPYRNLATSQPAATYTMADPVDDLTAEPQTRVANQVILHARRQGRSTLKSVATNADPADPNSTVRLGRTIVYGGGPIVVDDIETQADLNEEATRLLEEAREWEQVVVVRVLPQRPPGMLRTIDLALGGTKAHLDGRYSCRGWRVGLTPEDALLELELRRVIAPIVEEVAA